MNKKDKLELHLLKTIVYLESVAEKLKDRPEDNDTLNEINEVTIHLRECLEEKSKNKEWKWKKYGVWIVKAIAILKFIKSLFDIDDLF